MSNSLLDTLLLSSKIESSEDYDATYESLPVVIAESTKDLDSAFAKLDEAGGHGYIATWRKNLFAFNTDQIFCCAKIQISVCKCRC